MLERIGKYEIRLQIGRGAMGVVYEGFDPVIGRRVAVKMLRTEMFEPRQLPDVLVRFKREAQSVGRLSHPHIVTIHEFGEEQGTPYIVMEYMSGTELGHRLESGSRFTLDEVVRIMTQLLGALTHAHEHGVVHRDLKPANMFLLEDGSLKVVDFGIARVESSDLTDTGAMLGTPAYMSPEQCLGLQVDHRSDLFSAGVILYQLLTGDKPFTGSVTTIIQKVLRQEPIAPSELNPTLSSAWDKVVARAMAKKPEARYESARQFAEAIKAAHSAERAHEDEGRRKAAEAEEHANRAAEERSRAESLRRAEDERREAERRAHAEAEARKAAEARASREAKERTVAIPKPSGSRAPAIAAAIVVAAAILAGVLYVRQGAEDQASKAEAARAAAETRAREEGERRAKLETDVAKKEADAKREAELAARARAEDEAKKAVEEKAKALALRKEEEAKVLVLKKEAGEKARADTAKKAEEARQAARKPGTVFQDCPDCPRMVVIPAGEFTMGSPVLEAGREVNEGPQRRVSIANSFALGRNEVTVAQFRRFADETGYKTDAELDTRAQGCFGSNYADTSMTKRDWQPGNNWRRTGFEQADSHPVVCMSWNGAQAYVQWLSEKTGKRYRLPSEAEWEYAARAGTSAARYWGEDPGQACRFANVADQSRYQTWSYGEKHECNDGHYFTAPVGSFAANKFGLFDMLGNALEWTEDCWNASYAGAPTDGTAWIAGDCSQRVLRGGSWGLHPSRVRSAMRVRSSPDLRGTYGGFRLARTLEESDKRAKAETPARVEADKRSKLEADAAKTEEARRATPRSDTVFQECSGCPRMVVIPAGDFMMGSAYSEVGRGAGEGPVHRVGIPQPFALGRTEVTVAEFGRFAEEAGYKTEVEREVQVQYRGTAQHGCFAWADFDKRWNWRPGLSWRSPEYEQGERHPAVCISWNDTQAFVGWLSQKTGKQYRLPTEAEWEYAARAGTKSARYWGEEADQACSYANVADLTMHKSSSQSEKHKCDDGHLFAAPVGSFRPNHFGLYDMIGNLWEWTQDCQNNDYAGAPTDGSAWLTGDCARRIARGGGWYEGPNRQRSAVRGYNNTGHRSTNTGFRVARTLE